MKHPLHFNLSHLLISAVTALAASMPAVSQAQVAAMQDKNVTVISNNQYVVGNDTLTYSNYNISNTRIDTLFIKGTVIKLTLVSDTVKTVVTEEMEKWFTLKLEGKTRVGDIINNTRMSLEQSYGYIVMTGTVKNYGTFFNNDGLITNITDGRTKMYISGLIDGSYVKGSTRNVTIKGTFFNGKRSSFTWQKRNTSTGNYETVQQKNYDLNIASGDSLSIIDTLKVSDGSGDYRCLVSDSTGIWKIYSTVALYGTVEQTSSPLFGMLIFKTFKNGHVDGFDGKKDVYFFFTKDQQISFSLYDYDGNLIKDEAFVRAVYKKGNVTTTLIMEPNVNYYYTLYHVNDTITVYVELPSPTANESIHAVSGAKVWGSNGTLHISTPESVTVYVSTFDGHIRPIKAAAGDSQYYVGKGLFIVRIENKSWKLLL
jgi:hypothetical protein